MEHGFLEIHWGILICLRKTCSSSDILFFFLSTRALDLMYGAVFELKYFISLTNVYRLRTYFVTSAQFRAIRGHQIRLIFHYFFTISNRRLKTFNIDMTSPSSPYMEDTERKEREYVTQSRTTHGPP